MSDVGIAAIRFCVGAASVLAAQSIAPDVQRWWRSHRKRHDDVKEVSGER